MRKKKQALCRMTLWAMGLNIFYDMTCFCIALGMSGAIDEETGQLYTGFQMALPYLGHLASFVIAFGALAAKLRIDIVVCDNEKGWPRDYEKWFPKREFCYQMVLVGLLLFVATRARWLYSVLSFVVTGVLLLFENVLFRILYGRSQTVKISRRMKKQLLREALKEYLLRGENVRARGKGGMSNFTNTTEGADEYRPQEQRQKTEEDEPEGKAEESESLDVVNGFMLKSTDPDEADDDDYDPYAAFLEAQEKERGQEEHDANYYFG